MKAFSGALRRTPTDWTGLRGDSAELMFYYVIQCGIID
jgi:hypothetical protein